MFEFTSRFIPSLFFDADQFSSDLTEMLTGLFGTVFEIVSLALTIPILVLSAVLSALENAFGALT